MAGPSYNASAALTVTNLHSLASSQDWTAGWFSASINNTSSKYLDFHYGGVFYTHASNRSSIGTINVYVVSSVNDTPLWPTTASGTPGTEGAGSFADAEERDAACRLLCSFTTDASSSAVISMPQTSLVTALGLIMPPTHHCLFIAQSCASAANAGFAASGTVLYQTAIVAP